MKHRATIRTLLLLGVLLSFTWLARWLTEGISPRELFSPTGEPVRTTDPGLVGTAGSVGLFMLGAWIVSRLLKPIGLPAVTAYLLFGIAMGPGVLGLVTSAELGAMELVNGLAIALIALTAGGEIEFEFIKKSLKQIIIILAIQMTGVALITGAFAFFLLQWMGTEGLDGFAPLAAAAAILGTVSITNSPAVLLAVLAETRSAGVLSQASLAVTVCKDLVLIILFSLVMTVAGGVLLSSGGGEGVSGEQSLGMYLLIHLGGSLVVGLIAGVVLAAYTVRIGGALPIFLVFACLGIALVSDAFHLESLIVALVAGMVMGNLKQIRSDHFFETVEELSLPVYCVFFALAGAQLDLEIISSIAGWAMLFVAVRLAAVWAATTLAARVVKLESPAREWIWTTLVPQAGVTLALATVVRDTLGDEPYAQNLFALLMGLIAANQVVGPVLMKIGLTRAGEIGAAKGGSGHG